MSIRTRCCERRSFRGRKRRRRRHGECEARGVMVGGISYSGQVETRPSPVIISCHLFPLSRFHNYPSGVNFPSFLSPCSLFQYVRRYFQFFFSLALNNTTLKERKQPKDISTFLFSLSLPVCLFIAWAIYSLMATGSASANKRALIGLISLLFCFVCLRSPYTRYAHSRQ